ncbi:Ppx/GppA phosphatase family protein [Oceanobacillus kapialis]|uniref:Exopolyphosphatase n=1 Tax=Oceanobacillus kapialis TaxID=481353 RepID=A0ABW5Q390_9BACI
MNNNYAIIDIGSNTMRLVIYKQGVSGRLHEVQNVKSIARLRNNLNEDYVLTEEGITKLISTLRSFQKVVDTYTIHHLSCIATATIRQATNQHELVELVKQEIGWDMRILSEEEEAFYGYLSVVNSTSIEEGITIDIGGGSTEITYFEGRILKYSHSFPFGALTLKSLTSDYSSKEASLEGIRVFVQSHLQTLPWLNNRRVPVIGIGGSARNMAQIDQNKKAYPLAGLHQYEMSSEDVTGIITELASLDHERLEKVEGLSKDRADTIVPAMCVFEQLMKEVDTKCFILSRKGLRDGVFYELLSRKSNHNLYPNVLEDSLVELMHEYNLSAPHINHRRLLSKKLIEEVAKYGIDLLADKDMRLLEQACIVYNLGKYIDAESSSQHSFYLLANRTIDGLSHKERLTLALAASYKNKTIFKQFYKPYKNWFTKQEKKTIVLIGSLVKFVYSLDATGRQIVEDVKLEFLEDRVQLMIYCNEDPSLEQYQAEKQKKHIEKALHRNIELQFIS